MKNNYDESYLNRRAAIFLSAPVWKLYLPLRDETTTMFMLCFTSLFQLRTWCKWPFHENRTMFFVPFGSLQSVYQRASLSFID